MGVIPEIQEQMIKMMLTEEDQLEDVTIEQWFSPAFFQSQLWYYWSSMLAFQPYHSLIEMRRYAVRFMHQLHLIKSLRGILRTKYDQYNSLIRPLEVYLADHGVNFVSGATVTDMDIRIEGIDKTVTALHIGEGSAEQIVPIAEKDLVFFTNGSMTQNSTQGSMTEAPVMNRDTVHKGCFSLWEKLAAKCPEYGHPEKFAFDPDKSNFVSCSVTVRDYPQFFDYLAEKAGNPTGKGGCSTLVDAPWFINYNVPLQPVAPDQPENVHFMWFYGLHANNCGTYVKTPMTQCSGEEIMREFLYYCGLEDKIDEIMPHITAIPVVMPYITSQFMPPQAEGSSPGGHSLRQQEPRLHRPVRGAGGRCGVHRGDLRPHGHDRRVPPAAPRPSHHAAVPGAVRYPYGQCGPQDPAGQGQDRGQRLAEGQSPEAAPDHARDRGGHQSDPACTGVLFRAEGKPVNRAKRVSCLLSDEAAPLWIPEIPKEVPLFYSNQMACCSFRAVRSASVRPSSSP